jgi:hypothetical protein
MTEVTGCVVERVLVKRHQGLLDPTDDEIGIVEALGDDYLTYLDCFNLYDVALMDLAAIKEMRPDLGDEDIAYLVRTADDDEDAEMWMQRVLRFKSQDRRVA